MVASGEFMKVYSSINTKTSQYQEINDVLELLKKDPDLGDRIRQKLWPRQYVQKYGIHNLFRVKLNDGWRLVYTVSGTKQAKIVTILEIFDHGKYEKRFNY